MRTCQVTIFWSLLLLGLVGAGSPSPIQAQVFSITPTYQASIREFDTRLENANFEAWGVMLGIDAGQPGGWPHVWAQRYRMGSICPEARPGREDCRVEGWMVSLGPAIQFARQGRVTGTLIPTVGFDSGPGRQFTGGAGLHVDVEAGGFRPQFFGRFQMLRGQSYANFGVAVSFEFGEPRVAKDPGRGWW